MKTEKTMKCGNDLTEIENLTIELLLKIRELKKGPEQINFLGVL